MINHAARRRAVKNTFIQDSRALPRRQLQHSFLTATTTVSFSIQFGFVWTCARSSYAHTASRWRVLSVYAVKRHYDVTILFRVLSYSALVQRGYSWTVALRYWVLESFVRLNGLAMLVFIMAFFFRRVTEIRKEQVSDGSNAQILGCRVAVSALWLHQSVCALSRRLGVWSWNNNCSQLRRHQVDQCPREEACCRYILFRDWRDAAAGKNQVLSFKAAGKW